MVTFGCESWTTMKAERQRMFFPQEGEGHAGCWREGGPRERQERQKAVATEAEAVAGTRVSRGGLVQRAGCGPHRAWTLHAALVAG